jgi:hypothetical protein
MAMLVHFQGLAYASNTAEAFYAEGPFDTVSYERAPSARKVGDYDLGVTVNLTDPYLNTGWAQGDKSISAPSRKSSEANTPIFFTETRKQTLLTGVARPISFTGAAETTAFSEVVASTSCRAKLPMTS